LLPSAALIDHNRKKCTEAWSRGRGTCNGNQVRALNQGGGSLNVSEERTSKKRKKRSKIKWETFAITKVPGAKKKKSPHKKRYYKKRKRGTRSRSLRGAKERKEAGIVKTFKEKIFEEGD